MPNEAPAIFPTLRYHDAPAAIRFLEAAFGFRRLEVIENPDGTIAHAELAHGSSVVMLGSERHDPRIGERAGRGWLYVAVDDADAACERARAAGAEIVAEPYEQDYGSRDFTARDPEGNVWNFGTYRPSLDPDGAASGSER